MRDYGKVYSAFWLNKDMRGVSEDGRMLALYLMTCPHGNMLGCFRLPDGYAADDMQWQPERIAKAFRELFDRQFAYRCQESAWVLIRQYLKWNQFENPNVGKAAGKMFDSLPCPDLVKSLLVKGLREYAPFFDTRKLDNFESTAEAFANPFGLSAKTRTIARAITIAQPEPDPEPTDVDRRGAPLDRDVVPTVFAYWQKVMKSPNSKLDAKRIDLIRKALKLYEPRQLCEAILGCSRSPWNMGQNDRNMKYNGLGLILRSAEHIDKFIALASQTVVGEETLEQRNARIIAEFVADGVPDDPSVIDMEDIPDET